MLTASLHHSPTREQNVASGRQIGPHAGLSTGGILDSMSRMRSPSTARDGGRSRHYAVGMVNNAGCTTSVVGTRCKDCRDGVFWVSIGLVRKQNFVAYFLDDGEPACNLIEFRQISVLDQAVCSFRPGKEIVEILWIFENYRATTGFSITPPGQRRCLNSMCHPGRTCSLGPAKSLRSRCQGTLPKTPPK